MPRIYPNLPLCHSATDPIILTVWRKSLVFSCSGFTVYDAKGNLVFRVDNYPSSKLHEIVLMDVVGKPLFTIRQKRFTLIDQWKIYKGEVTRTSRPIFSAWKHVALIGSKSLAHITHCGINSEFNKAIYDVEGSFAHRSCVVYDTRNKPVAEIRRKEAVGGDVFRLFVQPGFDSALAMVFVILLERMFGSRVATVKD